MVILNGCIIDGEARALEHAGWRQIAGLQDRRLLVARLTVDEATDPTPNVKAITATSVVLHVVMVCLCLGSLIRRSPRPSRPSHRPRHLVASGRHPRRPPCR